LKKRGVNWELAADIKKRVITLAKELDLEWVNLEDIHCFRSKNSKSRAYARIWGLSKIWQKALKQRPSYIIEVLSEKFDKLSKIEQDKVLLHELTHIPKNFSGSLLPHIRKRGKRNFHDRVRLLVRKYNEVKLSNDLKH
jgi:predicted metallopeptidase